MIKLNNVCNANSTGNCHLFFSFDMIRTFASFSGHTLSVEVQRHRHLKFTKTITGMDLTSDKILLLFLLQGM